MESLNPLAVSAIALVAPLALVALAALLAALHKRASTDAKAGRFQLVLARVYALAEAVVRDLEATMKPRLLAASADGKLTSAEVHQLRNAAMTALKDSLGHRGLAEVQQLVGVATQGLPTFLAGSIEKALANVKAEKAALPLAPAAPTK